MNFQVNATYQLKIEDSPEFKALEPDLPCDFTAICTEITDDYAEFLVTIEGTEETACFYRDSSGEWWDEDGLFKIQEAMAIV